MAEEQQWEYCVLILYGSDRRFEERFYDLDVNYLGPNGRYRTLATTEGEDARAWVYNPWERAMGMLGKAGWELVNLQHAQSSSAGSPFGGPGKPYLIADNVFAYFKRPIQAGRRTDEPELILE